MAIVHLDGFDHYSNGGDNPSTTRYLNQSVNIDTGRFGTGKSMRYQGENASLAVPALTTSAIGFAMKASTSALAVSFIGVAKFIQSANNDTQFSLFTQSGGKIGVARNNSSSDIKAVSAINKLLPDVWHYVELVFTHSAVSDTGSSAEIFVDGVSVASCTGVNLRNNPNRTPDQITFNFQNTTYIDDMYITDTAVRLGELKIATLVPNADTAQKDFTASTGSSNYAMLDELPWTADTDYVVANVAGNADLYDLTTLADTPASILGLQVGIFARKDDAGARTIRANLKSGSTTLNGATRGIGSTYGAYYDTPVSLDPNTSAPWTLSAVNALQAGVEVVA